MKLYIHYLKKEFDYLTKAGATNEVALFNNLITAINNSKRFFKIAEKVHIDILHGPKSFTKFDVPSSISITNEERMCECQ